MKTKGPLSTSGVHGQVRASVEDDNMQLNGRIRNLEAQNRLLHQASQVGDDLRAQAPEMHGMTGMRLSEGFL